jgi:glycerophosphoryl diester phosphodiesterase
VKYRIIGIVMTELADLDLARRYAPVIYFDAAEPFLPLYAGYTVFRAAAPSPSFPRYVAPEPPAALAIEYAIWWDWDIQHLYELEHAWVFVDAAGAVAGVESSQHGASAVGGFELEDGRPVLYAEPGKHALASDRAQLLARKARTAVECGRRAGMGGVWVTPLFRGRIDAKNPLADQLVRTHLRRLAFEPRFEWSRRVDVGALPLMPWRLLDTAIPKIVAVRAAELDAAIPFEQRHVLHVGHRGASAHAPENTLAAIRKAAELGGHMVELDVRMSADDVPVLSHDADVTTPERGRVPVRSLTAAQLGALNGDYETSVPRLDDALDLCRQVGLGPYLEIKEGETVEPTVGMLSRRDLAKYSVIGSFNPAWVARATDRAPQIATSILFGSFDADPVALARGCGATYVHPCWERHEAPHTLLTPEWLARVRGEGLGVVCWHEERPAVLDALLRLGVSAVCTDRLDLIAEAAARLPAMG